MTYSRRRADDNSWGQSGASAIGAGGAEAIIAAGLGDIGEAGWLRGATVIASLTSIVGGQRLVADVIEGRGG